MCSRYAASVANGKKLGPPLGSEYGAKSYLFDITHIRGLFLAPLRKRQIIAAYRSPFRDALRREKIPLE